MTCSVLLPSLWRFEKLKKSVASFYETSSPENFEIIIRLHEKDDESISRIDELQSFGNNLSVKIMGEKPDGAGNNFLWNGIRPFAKGAWHQYWSDDMTITGSGWDKQLSELPTHGIIAHPEWHQLGGSEYRLNECGPVPFVPARCLEQYGFSTLLEPPDTTLDNILRIKHGWKSYFLPGIRVIHDRHADKTLPIA